jgi:hypothetical protein
VDAAGHTDYVLASRRQHVPRRLALCHLAQLAREPHGDVHWMVVFVTSRVVRCANPLSSSPVFSPASVALVVLTSLRPPSSHLRLLPFLSSPLLFGSNHNVILYGALGASRPITLPLLLTLLLVLLHSMLNTHRFLLPAHSPTHTLTFPLAHNPHVAHEHAQVPPTRDWAPRVPQHAAPRP